MKQLLPTIFTYASSGKSSAGSSTPQTPSSAAAIANDAAPICPSCSREMNNSGRAVLLISRTPLPSDGDEPAAKRSKKEKNGKDKDKEVTGCGHVVCGQCADTIVKPGKQCVVCEAIIRPDRDMIDLQKEGEYRLGLVCAVPFD